MVERFLHTEEATGSIPVSPTISLLILAPALSKAVIFIGMVKLPGFWTERGMSATLPLYLFGENTAIVQIWTETSEVML